MFFGDNKYMTINILGNIHKCECFVVLIYSQPLNFTGCYFTKYTLFHLYLHKLEFITIFDCPQKPESVAALRATVKNSDTTLSAGTDYNCFPGP